MGNEAAKVGTTGGFLRKKPRRGRGFASKYGGKPGGLEVVVVLFAVQVKGQVEASQLRTQVAERAQAA
jgi:hypothetical protein